MKIRRRPRNDRKRRHRPDLQRLEDRRLLSSDLFTVDPLGMFAVGSAPSDVVAGDFNGDHLADLVTVNSSGNSITELSGNGQGGFTDNAGPVAVGLGPDKAAAGDFNGDGISDLAITLSGSNGVAVRLGSLGGGFTLPTVGALGVGLLGPGPIVAADFNHDNHLDLAVGDQGDNLVHILLGDGLGNFTDTGSPITVGGAVDSLAQGSVNTLGPGADTLPDLLVGSQGNVSVELGDGSGGFTEAGSSPIATGVQTDSIAAGDFDGNGTLDFATTGAGSVGVAVYLGAGDGTFAVSASSPIVDTSATSVAAGDLDNDGLSDLVVTDEGTGLVQVLLSTGSSFSPASGSPYNSGFSPAVGAVSDLDGNGTLDIAAVDPLDNGVGVLLNNLPDAVDDSYVATHDTTLTVGAAQGVLLNDSSPVADPFLPVLVQGPAHGSLNLGSDGSFSYTPDAGFTGTDSFAYQDFDVILNGRSRTATVSLSVVNHAPVATDDSETVVSDHTLSVAAPGILGNDTDADGDALSAVLVSAPGHGTLTLKADGSLSYTPNAGFTGGDSFTYQASDGLLTSNTATVSLTVNPNQAPVAKDDSFSVNENAPLNVAAPGILGNDTDAEGDALTAGLVTGPSHGTLALKADGSFDYTPNSLYFGSDSFTYQASDGITTSATATVTITVNHVNQPPTAVDDSYTPTENHPLTIAAAAGVLANDTDPDHDSLSVAQSTVPSHGSVTLNANGSFTYTPNAGYVGGDSFTYQASDGSLTSNSATVSLTIAPDHAPAALGDSYSLQEETPLAVPAPGVLGNDTDADADPLTAVLVSGPSHGSLTLKADGSFTYTPDALYHGTDSFTYRASDGTLSSTPATVSLSVAQVNHLPVVTVLPVHAVQGIALTGVAVASFTDADDGNQPSSYTATVDWGDGTPRTTGVVSQSGGTLRVSGSHVYAQPGSYTVQVGVTDPSGGTGTGSGQANVAVSPPPPGPGTPRDTRSPQVQSAVLDLAHRRFLITFQDDLSGMNLASVLNVVNYNLFRQPGRANGVPVTAVAPVSSSGGQGGPATTTVAVVFGAGAWTRRGAVIFQAFGRGITDRAGNALDGAFFGTFPTGVGLAGSNFAARFRINGHTASPARPLVVTHPRTRPNRRTH